MLSQGLAPVGSVQGSRQRQRQGLQRQVIGAAAQKKRLNYQALLSLCAVALSHGSDADVHFKVGSPVSLLGHQQMIDWNVQWPDASLFAIRNKTGYAFFMEGGPPGDTPGTPWTIMSSGAREGLAVQERIATGVTLEGFPCPPGFPAPCIRLDPDPGSLNLLPCDKSLNQQWNFSSGKAVNSTNVQSLAAGSDGKPGGCWEINGCSGPDVDTNFGCKRLPQGLLPCIGCCNMAWRFLDNGTIISGMRGKGGAPQCLQVSDANPTRVVVGLCTGSVREIWQVVGRTIRAHAQAHGFTDSTQMCIDNRKLPSETANTVGAWVGNVYHDFEADGDDDHDGVLMLIHMEFRTATTDGVGCYFRFGLAYSANGPIGPFNWCGYVAEPALSFEHTVHGHKYGRPDWFPNMGLPSYIIRDGFIHVLYGDTNELGEWAPSVASAKCSECYSYTDFVSFHSLHLDPNHQVQTVECTTSAFLDRLATPTRAWRLYVPTSPRCLLPHAREETPTRAGTSGTMAAGVNLRWVAALSRR
jgi:hypothetical protein